MLTLASRRRILALAVAVVGISQGFCEGSKSPLSPNLKAAVDKVLSAPKPADRLKGLAETAKNVSLEEIPGALERAKSFQQLREQAVFKEAILKRWSELAPGEAFVYIAALPESRIKLEAIRFAATKFATRNCEEASRAVEKASAGRSRNEAVDVVAGIWARKNVKEALKWASALPAGFARESALNSVRFIWVHGDPVSAAEHLNTVAEGDTRNALLANIAGEWAALDPQAALRWGNSFNDGPEKDLVMGNIAESWADSDPMAAAAFAMKLSGTTKHSATAAVISRWATQNPEAAMNWVLKTGDDAIQTRALSEVLNLWASVDASEAGKWVENLSPGLPRESAIRSYSEAVVTWEPSEAVRLASMLEDESARMQQVEKCLPRWIELDKSGALKWIETSALPPELKRKWIKD